MGHHNAAANTRAVKKIATEKNLMEVVSDLGNQKGTLPAILV